MPKIVRFGESWPSKTHSEGRLIAHTGKIRVFTLTLNSPPKGNARYSRGFLVQVIINPGQHPRFLPSIPGFACVVVAQGLMVEALHPWYLLKDLS